MFLLINYHIVLIMVNISVAPKLCLRLPIFLAAVLLKYLQNPAFCRSNPANISDNYPDTTPTLLQYFWGDQTEHRGIIQYQTDK